MDFPKQTKAHIIEQKALEILSRQLPDEWLVREITKRDYGIDLYVEIVRRDGKITGELIALQVKGKQKIDFDESESFTFYTIKTSTLNYWLHLPVPVFLIVVCLNTKKSYWCNIRDTNRCGKFVLGKRKTVYTKLEKKTSISENGLRLLELNYFREKRWPAVENAIERSLMLFNSFGPFVLMCRRKPDAESCSTTVQYIFLEYYECFCLLSRYILGNKPKPIPEWYDRHIDELKNVSSFSGLTFSYKIIKEAIMYFASDYRDAIRVVNLMVVKYHSDYYKKKFPYLQMHLKNRPLTFVETDWHARYYHDEYENETRNIEKQYFDDFTLYDGHDLINDLNI